MLYNDSCRFLFDFIMISAAQPRSWELAKNHPGAWQDYPALVDGCFPTIFETELDYVICFTYPNPFDPSSLTRYGIISFCGTRKGEAWIDDANCFSRINDVHSGFYASLFQSFPTGQTSKTLMQSIYEWWKTNIGVYFNPGPTYVIGNSRGGALAKMTAVELREMALADSVTMARNINCFVFESCRVGGSTWKARFDALKSDSSPTSIVSTTGMKYYCTVNGWDPVVTSPPWSLGYRDETPIQRIWFPQPNTHKFTPIALNHHFLINLTNDVRKTGYGPMFPFW